MDHMTDEQEKARIVAQATAERMDPNIIKALSEAPAGSALIDAAARAKTPAEMMEQFANLDPAIIPPEMRHAVEQFKEQQQQSKLEDEALLKKAALAAEAGFMAFAAGVTTANRAEAASNSVAAGKAPSSTEFAKMSAAEQAVYFRQLRDMSNDEFANLNPDVRRQHLENNLNHKVDRANSAAQDYMHWVQESEQNLSKAEHLKVMQLIEGLDLTTPEGQKMAQERLQQLSAQYPDNPSVAHYGEQIIAASIKLQGQHSSSVAAQDATQTNDPHKQKPSYDESVDRDRKATEDTKNSLCANHATVEEQKAAIAQANAAQAKSDAARAPLSDDDFKSQEDVRAKAEARTENNAARESVHAQAQAATIDASAIVGGFDDEPAPAAAPEVAARAPSIDLGTPFGSPQPNILQASLAQLQPSAEAPAMAEPANDSKGINDPEQKRPQPPSQAPSQAMG